MELVYEHLGRKPVVAVIYTHSHIDHWGGVKGVISEEDVKAGEDHGHRAGRASPRRR